MDIVLLMCVFFWLRCWVNKVEWLFCELNDIWVVVDVESVKKKIGEFRLREKYDDC